MSAQFLERHPVPASVRIIDLSHDFRLKSNAGDFVYGLPELNRGADTRSLARGESGMFRDGQ